MSECSSFLINFYPIHKKSIYKINTTKYTEFETYVTKIYKWY